MNGNTNKINTSAVNSTIHFLLLSQIWRQFYLFVMQFRTSWLTYARDGCHVMSKLLFQWQLRFQLQKTRNPMQFECEWKIANDVGLRQTLVFTLWARLFVLVDGLVICHCHQTTGHFLIELPCFIIDPHQLFLINYRQGKGLSSISSLRPSGAYMRR